METPIVLFRDRRGAPHALVDRCPHRNAPLSLGSVVDGTLQCGYHGWRFDGSGTCAAVPGLDATPDAPNRSATSHAVTEADGFVWIWGEPGASPSGRPFAFPSLAETDDHRRVGRTVFQCDLESTMHAALENALDVPHTAYLHGGIFRGKKAATRDHRRPARAARRHRGAVPGRAHRLRTAHVVDLPDDRAPSSTGTGSSCRRSPRSSTAFPAGCAS